MALFLRKLIKMNLKASARSYKATYIEIESKFEENDSAPQGSVISVLDIFTKLSIHHLLI